MWKVLCIVRCQAYGLLTPHSPYSSSQPTSTHQKTLFTPANLSLMYFSQDIQVPVNSFCVKGFKLTIVVPRVNQIHAEACSPKKLIPIHHYHQLDAEWSTNHTH